MQAELRKMAAQMREAGKQAETTKLVKCAQAAQALTALELLRRKLSR